MVRVWCVASGTKQRIAVARFSVKPSNQQYLFRSTDVTRVAVAKHTRRYDAALRLRYDNIYDRNKKKREKKEDRKKRRQKKSKGRFINGARNVGLRAGYHGRADISCIG